MTNSPPNQWSFRRFTKVATRFLRLVLLVVEIVRQLYNLI